MEKYISGKNTEFNISEELKKLPHKPGVYLMHSDSEEILYVGKAVDLHNRVRQYFQKGHGHNGSQKIAKMVEQIDYFEYIITSSEMEALVLECNLIKEHHPRYNTMMRDDKGYPYIKITTYEDYPRVMYSHQMHRDKCKYFGPYTDGKAVHDIIELLRKLFKIRNCNRNLPKDIGKERPCLYHQINMCSGPCGGYISKEEYNKNISSVISFLNGDTKEILSSLTERMKEEASSLEFEKAAATRDLIESINHIMDKQRITDTEQDNRDIIAMARNDRDCVVSIFFVRDGQLLGRENHHMTIDETGDDDSSIITAFVKQYYSSTPYIPKEILSTIPVNEEEVITAFLSEKRGSKVHIIIPKRGDKKGLVSLAEDNASLVLAQDIERIKRKEKRTVGAAKEIAEIVGIEKATRLEAFDISNISGYNSVASMVVFENGSPKRNAYRKFRLRTVEGPNDYASMKEVLSRRFSDEKIGPFPDVLMMDGGKGQVNIAKMVLDSLGIDIPVCGMVKDDNHRTRGLYFNNEEVDFKKGSEAIHMVTALQDETHRFAITYHKLLRSKEQVHSILDDIEGIGPARRKALLLHFKDIEEIKAASLDELLQVEGMNKKSAAAVYHFFH